MDDVRPLREVLAGLSDGTSDPRAALAAGGHADLPDALVPTAIAGYAQTAPAEVAEHLHAFLADGVEAADPDAGLALLASAPAGPFDGEVDLDTAPPEPEDALFDAFDDDPGPSDALFGTADRLDDDGTDDPEAHDGSVDPVHDAEPSAGQDGGFGLGGDPDDVTAGAPHDTFDGGGFTDDGFDGGFDGSGFDGSGFEDSGFDDSGFDGSGLDDGPDALDVLGTPAVDDLGTADDDADDDGLPDA